MSNRAVANWGNYPRIRSELIQIYDSESIRQEIKKCSSIIVRGQGRSYGDASLNTRQILDTTLYNDFILFNRTTGELIAEAGTSFDAILKKTADTGWFLPVVPGTKYISVGGAIAANIHGKNHHTALSLANHINWLSLMLADGSVIRCSKIQNQELFYATCGGQGLTGVILYVSIQMKKYETTVISQKNEACTSLQELVTKLKAANESSEYTVAWVDLVSSNFKGLVFSGDFISDEELSSFKDLYLKSYDNSRSAPLLGVPFYSPSILINRISVCGFNQLYYRVNSLKKQRFHTTLDHFFFPLDAVRHWNRLYGYKGFIQYQFVLPEEEIATLERIIKLFKRANLNTPLAVLKICGDEPSLQGSLSFCRKGLSLALDFKYSDRLLSFLNKIDSIVAQSGGRVYLAKDSRMSASAFREMYGKSVDEFMEIKARYDPDCKFSSLLGQRLKLCI